MSTDPFRRVAFHEAGHVVVGAALGLKVYLARIDRTARAGDGKKILGICIAGTPNMPWPEGKPRDREYHTADLGGSAVAVAAYLLGGVVAEELYAVGLPHPADDEPGGRGDPLDPRWNDGRYLADLALTADERHEAEELARRILTISPQTVARIADVLLSGESFWLEDAEQHGARIEKVTGG